MKRNLCKNREDRVRVWLETSYTPGINNINPLNLKLACINRYLKINWGTNIFIFSAIDYLTSAQVLAEHAKDQRLHPFQQLDPESFSQDFVPLILSLQRISFARQPRIIEWTNIFKRKISWVKTNMNNNTGINLKTFENAGRIV